MSARTSETLHITSSATVLHLQYGQRQLTITLQNDALRISNNGLLSLDNLNGLIKLCYRLLKPAGRQVKLQKSLQNDLPPVYESWLPAHQQHYRALQNALHTFSQNNSRRYTQLPSRLLNDEALMARILLQPAAAYAFKLSATEARQYERACRQRPYLAETLDCIRQPLPYSYYDRLLHFPLSWVICDARELIGKLTLYVPDSPHNNTISTASLSDLNYIEHLIRLTIDQALTDPLTLATQLIAADDGPTCSSLTELADRAIDRALSLVPNPKSANNTLNSTAHISYTVRERIKTLSFIADCETRWQYANDADLCIWTNMATVHIEDQDFRLN